MCSRLGRPKHVGLLVHRSAGLLVFWSSGVLVNRSIGLSVSRSFSLLVCGSFGLLFKLSSEKCPKYFICGPLELILRLLQNPGGTERSGEEGGGRGGGGERESGGF